jgi:ABC-type lipoprotein release transport system permease subunit
MVALTVLAMLIFAALVAILVPAPRAWRVHPAEALRHERSAGHE